MKRIHRLRYDGDPGALAPLLEAVAAEGLRVGWLELSAEVPPVPAGLDAASSAGAFRAVSVGGGRSVAIKHREGPPVLQDLLREHFLGCALVVIRPPRTGAGAGETPGPAAELADLALLEAAAEGYRVCPPGEAGRVFAPPALAARLRRPRPW